MTEVETFEDLLNVFNYPLHPSKTGEKSEEKDRLPPFEKILTRVVPEIQKCIDPKTDADCVLIVTSKSYGGGKSTFGGD